MEVIRAEKLSKKFLLGSRAPYSFRELIMGALKSSDEMSRELWALRNVSFSVKDGETLGLVGNNGAGKSTLLKILSRITKPTTGTATLHGRVGSLLEVGTGFHAELSGRENIYLNGAILGMRRAEITARFDEIVAFSEIEQFLDTPVKHYSTGMYMRLAFSIAAHLEPEILIVDEVLAVGDLGFQKKCLSKMKDIGGSGRTVLFVSHDLSAVARLCGRVIWLDDGQIRADGETQSVISGYVHKLSRVGADRSWDEFSPGNDKIRLRRVRICDESGKSIASEDIRKPIDVEITYDVLEEGIIVSPSFHLNDDRGTCIFVSLDQDKIWQQKERKVGRYMSRARIPGNFLAEGTVFVKVVIATIDPLAVHVAENDVVAFSVIENMGGDSARGSYSGQMPGAVRPILEWVTEVQHDR